MSTLGSNEIQKILGLRLMIGNSDTELKDIQPISLPPKLREYTQEPDLFATTEQCLDGFSRVYNPCISSLIKQQFSSSAFSHTQ
ncbi:hypothetical protein ACN38_g7398 [Penicillium nordicum]|uniref:Uncharacterized protein n=1 Tax=Penicillium nordicum TaxID=229535 RepID=A0A0M9WEG3_9EURO|nr:hypothetical protein ACN38_g7398 [Penicillium nordicum]